PDGEEDWHVVRDLLLVLGPGEFVHPNACCHRLLLEIEKREIPGNIVQGLTGSLPERGPCTVRTSCILTRAGPHHVQDLRAQAEKSFAVAQGEIALAAQGAREIAARQHARRPP